MLYAIPADILGAACFYSATFTLKTGIGMLSQRLIDARRTLVIGSGIVVSVLATDIKGMLHLPSLGQQLMNSPLATAMLAALALNAVLRLGISKDASLRWRPGNAGALKDFCEAQGRAWGARVDLIRRAGNFLEEFAILAPRLARPDTDAGLELRYDEVGLQIELSWQGEPVNLGGSVNMEADDGSLQVTLMRHWADEMNLDSNSDDRQILVAYVDDR